jgi:hypothetical protein
MQLYPDLHNNFISIKCFLTSGYKLKMVGYIPEQICSAEKLGDS